MTRFAALIAAAALYAVVALPVLNLAGQVMVG